MLLISSLMRKTWNWRYMLVVHLRKRKMVALLRRETRLLSLLQNSSHFQSGSWGPSCSPWRRTALTTWGGTHWNFLPKWTPSWVCGHRSKILHQGKQQSAHRTSWSVQALSQSSFPFQSESARSQNFPHWIMTEMLKVNYLLTEIGMQNREH